MTSDMRKTKKELIAELESLRQTVEKLQPPPKKTDKHLHDPDPALARLLFDEFMDPVMVANTNGQVVAANRAAEAFFGYPREKLFSMHQQNFHPAPFNEKDFSLPFLEHLENPGKIIETPLKLASGEIRHAVIKACTFELDGTPLIMGIFRDITEPRRMEKELEQTQDRLKGMFTHLSSGVAIYKAVDDGTDFIFKDFNPAAERITRISKEKALGKRLLTLFPYMNKSPLLGALARVWKTGQAEDIPPFHYKDDVRDGWRENHIYKLPSGEVVAVFTDVTERMEALNAVKASEKRFKTLLEDVDMVAVQGYDENRRVVYWNRASQALYGYAKSEAVGQKLEDLIIPDHMRDAVVHGVNTWLENGKAIPSGELDLKRKDGSLVPVYSSHVMQKNPNGTQTMYCIDVELSEIRNACNQLRQAKEDAESANKAKSVFLANMSHDIRTPLNGVLGMLQLLQTTDLDEEQDNYVQNASNSSKRLTALLSDILDLSRVEAGHMALTKAPLFLKRTMAQVKELFMPTERQSQVTLKNHIHPKTTSELLGDATRLQQVLSNIIGNAFKFTPQGGTITVETYPLPAPGPGKAKILFSVADTGIGISDARLDTLFDPFVQGDQPNFGNNQGAGLGLAISKRIVKLMGGNMAVESEESVGTNIYFCAVFDLPCHGCATPHEPDHVEPTETIKGLRILLAEDEKVNSLIASRLLTKSEAIVTAVTNGKQAVAALNHQKFDLILMDIQMPIMNGVEATRIIRQSNGKNANIPIIAMTAYAMVGDRETFLDAGMDDYVAKPMEMDELSKAIARTLTNTH